MKAIVLNLFVISSMLVLTSCAASDAAENGVADHQKHLDTYKVSPTNNGSEMATKMNLIHS